MAAFDPNLDKNLFSESIDFEGTRITVGVFSYNDNPTKMQLSRERINAEGGSSFAKLGRITKEEAEKIIPIMKKALDSM